MVISCEFIMRKQHARCRMGRLITVSSTGGTSAPGFRFAETGASSMSPSLSSSTTTASHLWSPSPMQTILLVPLLVDDCKRLGIVNSIRVDYGNEGDEELGWCGKDPFEGR